MFYQDTGISTDRLHLVLDLGLLIITILLLLLVILMFMNVNGWAVLLLLLLVPLLMGSVNCMDFPSWLIEALIRMQYWI